MVEVKINYSCGCGFKTTNQEEAVKHAKDAHHCLSILGAITTPKIVKAKKDGHYSYS